MQIPGTLNTAVSYVPQNSVEKQYYQSMFGKASVANAGRVTGKEAVIFLKQSNVDVSTLKQIWDIADYDGKGYLDYAKFSIALRLISLKQQGVGPLSAKLVVASSGQLLPLPKFNGVQLPAAQPNLNHPDNGAFAQKKDDTWTIDLDAKKKYLVHFSKLDMGQKGFLTGVEARTFMMKSHLPHDVLGKIWDLSDIDKNGCLSKTEFCIAFHLIVKITRYGKQLPKSIPTNLLESAKVVEGQVSVSNTSSNAQQAVNDYHRTVQKPVGKINDSSERSSNNFSQQSQQVPAQSPNTKAKNIANAVADALGIDMSAINESGISGKKNSDVAPGLAGNLLKPQNIEDSSFVMKTTLQQKQFNKVETPSDNVIAESALEVSGNFQPNTSEIDTTMPNQNMNFSNPKNDADVMLTSKKIEEAAEKIPKVVEKSKSTIQRSVENNKTVLKVLQHSLNIMKDEQQQLLSILTSVQDTIDTVKEESAKAASEEEQLRKEVAELRQKIKKKRDELWEKRGNNMLLRGKRQELTHIKKVLQDEIKQVKAEIRDFSDSAKDLDHLRSKHDEGIQSIEKEIQSLQQKLSGAKKQRDDAKKQYQESKTKLHQSTELHEQKIASKRLLNEQVTAMQSIEDSFSAFSIDNQNSHQQIQSKDSNTFGTTQFVNLEEDSSSIPGEAFSETTTTSGFSDTFGVQSKDTAGDIKSGDYQNAFSSSEPNQAFNSSDEDDANDMVEAENISSNDGDKVGEDHSGDGFETFGGDAVFDTASGSVVLETKQNDKNSFNSSDEFIGAAQAASNGESNALDAFGSSDQFNSNNVNDGFGASLGENAFEAFDEADSNNDKEGKSNFNSSKTNDGFNVPDDTAFGDDAFSNATDSKTNDGFNVPDDTAFGDDAFSNATDSIGNDGFGNAEDAFTTTGDAFATSDDKGNFAPSANKGETVDTMNEGNVFDDAFDAFPSGDNDEKDPDDNNVVGDDDPFSSFGDF